MPGPLTGLRVVDFSRVLAGPLCGKTLADLGAEVIKVEPPRPDTSRFALPGRRGVMSGYYAQQNAGKRAVSLNLWVDGAREAALRLCDTADIVVENFRPGTLPSFGLGYEDVAARNPGVVYVSITGYGQDGPWQGRSAYAPTVQAESGITANTHRHYAESGWRTDSMSHADVYSGLHAVIAVLAALHQRAVSGEGQYIDIAMAAVMVSVNERVHADLSNEDIGDEPAILGATDTPFFATADGRQFTVASNLVGSLTFEQYLRAMRRPDLADDSRFRTASDRLKYLREWHMIVQDWIGTFANHAALDAQLDEAKIASGGVRTVRELAATDWARHWGAFAEVPDRAGGTYHVPGRPWRFSGGPLPAPGRPGFQGEDNRVIFAELGLSDEEITDLEEREALISAGRAGGGDE